MFKKIRDLAERYELAWISEHLCFTQFAGYQHHDLLPFPYTAESFTHISERVMKIPDYLDRPLVIENVSTYVQFKQSEITEAEFLSQLCTLTGSEILLDINNTYVNERNHGIDAREFINSLPVDKIKEVHLAGYEEKEEYLIDAYNNKVSDEVWELYNFFCPTRW